MRYLIISNRLPITVVKEGKSFKFQKSAGGLVSAMGDYLDRIRSSPSSKIEYIWVGWPGLTVDNKMQKELKSQMISEFDAYPVFLSEKVMDNFYNGFCNKIIWPLFHYFPSYVVYDENYWNHYKQVNETFCNVVMEIIRPDDIVWIHDYHLMLLPNLLRKRFSDISIGFFLHIPFPSYEVFRILPNKWRAEILDGLLGADLIGFHTNDYTQYFLRCTLRILGYEHNMGDIIVNERMVKAGTFPIGIDFQKYHNAISAPQVQDERKGLMKNFAGYKVILSIDRLDYTKGITNRLRAYQLFLEKNPQMQNKVILVLIVVPSRIGVEHYQQKKKQIEELVGEINGSLGSINWTPVLYQYKFLPFHQLVALYSVSDVALITPLRDGMNLIAKEYISAKTDNTGVLILSETAGASRELGEAIIINPNHIEGIAQALKEALEMPVNEQIRRNQIMRNRLKNYDVFRWVEDFLGTLRSFKDKQKKLESKLLTSNVKEQLIKDFSKGKQRLFLLDYDGTLVPFSGYPQNATPPQELLRLLERLSEDKSNQIVLITGRDRDTLQKWFGTLPISLVSEHGVWIKEKNSDWQMIKPLSKDWMPEIRSIISRYLQRLPYSFIEEKEFSIAFHYRMAEPDLSSIISKELADDLINFTANIDLQVLQGNKVLEVKSGGVNKGTAGMYFMSKLDYDFVLAIGDDSTDEELFKVLSEKHYSIKVGMTQSYARFNLHNHFEVIELLNELVK